MAVAAGLGAAAPLVTAEARMRTRTRHELRRVLAAHVRRWQRGPGDRGGLPVIGTIDDLMWLGVKPAARIDGWRADGVPPYLPRRVDRRLDQAVRTQPFVLVAGESAAGKTRVAFESVRRCFPQRALLVPAERASVPVLAAMDVEFPDLVVWLDDLDTYLGPDGLSPVTLDRLVSRDDRAVSVVGTIRSGALDRYGGDQAAGRLERHVLDAAHVLWLEPQLDEAERATARQHPLAGVVERLGPFGLGEYLAAGRELVSRFENGRTPSGQPAGAAIVRAAADWRRTGLTRSVPRNMLRRLFPLFVDDRIHLADTDTAFAQGLAWALDPVVATSSLLVRDGEGYRVFDYVLDHIERDRRFPLQADAVEIISEALTPGEKYRLGVITTSDRSSGDTTVQGVGNIVLQQAWHVFGQAPDSRLQSDYRAVVNQLPARSPMFTGREDVLGKLRSHADAAEDGGTPNLIWISGRDGSGKTALSIEFAYQVAERYPDGQIFIDTSDLPDRDHILVQLLLTLGLWDTGSQPGDDGQRIVLYQEALAGQRMLIILDDVRSPEQIDGLIPRQQGCLLVVTSQVPPGITSEIYQRSVVPVGPLSEQEAVDLLRKRAGEESDIARLFHAVGGYPRALSQAAAILSRDPELPIPDLLKRVESRVPGNDHS